MCPDICPDELDKMGQAIEIIERSRKEKVLPIFISVDPARDTVEAVRKYVKGQYTQALILHISPKPIGCFLHPFNHKVFIVEEQRTSSDSC